MDIMKEIQKLTEEITQLTLKIESDYPELYRYLDENPMTLPAGSHPEIEKDVLSKYLQSLKEQLRHHLETHNKTNNTP
jgi:hypothetical protein